VQRGFIRYDPQKENNVKRVVITGMGVVAPNAVGVADFTTAIKSGQSGIAFLPELEELKFSCQLGGIPPVTPSLLQRYFSDLTLKQLKANGIRFGCIAGIDAWQDAGLAYPVGKEEDPNWEAGCVFGAGMSGMSVIRRGIYTVDEGKVKRLGSSLIQQTMPSGISAYLSGMLGLGNQVSTNASACSTGTEAVILGFERIRSGKAKVMLCGSCDSYGPYVWGGFDSMRVLCRKSNDSPEKASRPMSESAAGFVPGSGAGALVLEDLDHALERGAKIYAEVVGGYINSGGHRQGGTMTAPNPQGIQRCIAGALNDAQIQASEIDAISGHLTSTMGDVLEVQNWSKALDRKGKAFPKINALKSMIGHCLSAAGAIESVAAILQLNQQFLHPSINCEDLHPEIADIIDQDCIPRETSSYPLNIIAKSSFGFGDVNSILLFKRI